MKNIIISVAIMFVSVQLGFSQGFVNLDFEQANLSGYGPGSVPATNAFPGWIVNAPYVFYSDFSLSGGSISIIDTNSLLAIPPIQGSYLAYFRGSNPNSPYFGNYPISLGQTGLVPGSAQSIIFWGDDQGFQVTFEGQPLYFFAAGATANYTVYEADISAYAGLTGQLLITAPPGMGGTIDNIQFSTTPVPEPSELALAALGAVLFGFRRWKK